MMSKVLESAGRVAVASRLVQIDDRALAHFCKALMKGGLQIPTWDDAYHFNDGTEETVTYLLVLDTLNACFWPAPGTTRWEIDYDSVRLSGYHALAACLKRAFESEASIRRADQLAGLTLDDLAAVFAGRGRLQLMERRRDALRELGRGLLSAYEGKAHRLVESAGGSAVGLAELLADRFASFRDVATYQGRKVYFYKRAQIFATDLHAAFGGHGWGRFEDLDELTAFADYKLPQVLRHEGILCYSEKLAHKVDQKIPLEAGSAEEVEIRANTIQAVEMIRQELNGKGNPVRAFEVDWILWNMGQADAFRKKPYHRTVSIFY
jgi:hypothetical protein